MIINIASKNPVKIDAFRDVLSEYTLLADCEIYSYNAKSGVSEQPKSLDEIIKGAINRAQSAFNGCKYSVGLESGLTEVPHTKTGFMELCACVIYDGKTNHLGLSCAFEVPIEIIKRIKEESLDLNEASYRTGITKDRKIGSSDGIIGLLTKGRVTRKEYTKQAIKMALIHLENEALYTK